MDPVRKEFRDTVRLIAVRAFLAGRDHSQSFDDWWNRVIDKLPEHLRWIR